jgi:hypothetical protein
MASFRKRGANWFFTFTGPDGARVERKGCSDRRVTEDLARAAELKAAGLWEKSPRERAMHIALKTINPLLEARAAPVEPRENAWSIPRDLEPWAEHLLSLDGSPVCVYFLIRNSVVVYVGQTTDLYFRVSQHRRDKQFDRVFYLPIPREDLSRIETGFIRVLQPEYNLQGKGE